jgi:hypothetical protein
MNFYNAFGNFYKTENFTQNNQEKKEEESEKSYTDLTDYNVYSHITLSSTNNKIRITLFPLYFGDKGQFNLSTKGDGEIKNNVIKKAADSSYINNPVHLGKMIDTDRDLFKAFRIYNKRLQMIDNGDNKVNLTFDPLTKKINNSNILSNLHLFDFSPSGSEINIFNNDPEGSFYKVNKTRNTFYLTNDKENKQYVRTTLGSTENKEDASIFMFKEIDPNQTVRNETRINIPKEEKDGSGAIRNIDTISSARIRRVSFAESFKYNLIELVKTPFGELEKVKLKLIKDEIRGTVVFVPLKKEEDTQPYQLHIWVNKV